MDSKAMLSDKDFLRMQSLALKRVHEIVQDKIALDISRLDQLDNLDQAYLLAYWELLVSRVLNGCKDDRIELPAMDLRDFGIQTAVIDQKYGTTLNDANKSVELVKKRLESTKRLLGDRFVNTFRSAVCMHEITSPIEQLFLIEWQYSDVESRFNVDLELQAEIDTPAGKYRVDFLITSKSTGEIGTALVIELDGHDFHERTKEQVAYDNKRARALAQAGMTVVRFSGHEMVTKARDCIKDVIALIEQAHR
jgi:very-short-patch-repair endonuclease